MLEKIVLNIIMVHGYSASEVCKEKCWLQILRKESKNGLLLVKGLIIAIVIIKSKINIKNDIERRFIILRPV